MADREQSDPRIVSVDSLAEGKWLRLVAVRYRDDAATERVWESADRQGEQGAVLMIPVLQPSGALVFIEQFRPPVRAYVLEFPAGLVDQGEDPCLTAVRELKEETGYTGVVRSISPSTCSSAGMTGESVRIAWVDIDETDPVNMFPDPECEEGEFIEVFAIQRDDLSEFVRRRLASGRLLDSKTAALLLGLGVDLGGG